MSLASGHTVCPIPDELQDLAKLFLGRNETIHLKPDNWTFYDEFEKFADKYYNFKLYEDDVFITTFPKCGTTWMQEIVWTLRNNLNLDNPAAKMPLAQRSPAFEIDICGGKVELPKTLRDYINQACPGYDHSEGLFIKAAEIQPRPRYIKTHLGLPFLPKNLLDVAKVVYVIRDPLDAVLSNYHHNKLWMFENFVGTLDQHIDAFINDLMCWGPFWTHVKSAWDKRDHPNLLIVFYDQLKRNTKQEYRKISEFLGVNPTDDQLDKIVHHTSFAEMKKRDDHVVPSDDAPTYMSKDIMEKEGGFFRKGVSGAWKEELNAQQIEKINDWIEKNCPDKEIMKIIRGEN